MVHAEAHAETVRLAPGASVDVDWQLPDSTTLEGVRGLSPGLHVVRLVAGTLHLLATPGVLVLEASAFYMRSHRLAANEPLSLRVRNPLAFAVEISPCLLVPFATLEKR